MLAARKRDTHNLQYIDRPEVAVSNDNNMAIDRKLRCRCARYLVIVVMLFLAIILQSQLIVSGNYELARTKLRVAELEKSNPVLKMELARLKSPQNIQKIATSQLKMTRPEDIFVGTVVEIGKKPQTTTEDDNNSVYAQTRH